MTIDDTVKIVRRIKWEEARGSLRAVVATYPTGSEAQEALEKAFSMFLDEVEDEGILEA